MEFAAQHQVISSQSTRLPRREDYWLFFVGIPLAIAFLFSLVGIRLIAGMPYFDGLLYMVVHMFLAWWSVSVGAWSMKYLCRSWRPPVAALCVMGFFVTLVPTAFLFQKLGAVYADIYPVFAANRSEAGLPEWSLHYIFHFIRYSIPAVPLFMAGVYGYRLITGVAWLTYPATTPPTPVPASIGNAQVQEARSARPLAGQIPGSNLPRDAEIIAVKAEQHYIRIWSDQGTDMVRFRFRDIEEALAGSAGAQVHRSWWVNLDQVAAVERAGRRLELRLNNGMSVPVSVAHKKLVMSALDDRGYDLGDAND